MAKIQVRRDTAANWTSANPTLSAGEIGFETNTGKLKVGDGSTAWNSLRYSGLPNVGISTPQTGEVLKFDGTKWTNAADATGSSLFTAGSGSMSVRFMSGMPGSDENSASGAASAVLGGWYNEATDFYTVVCGGQSNAATARGAAVLGGVENLARADFSAVVGGNKNIAAGFGSVAGAGNNNQAAGAQSVVVGGESNIASGELSCVLGGKQAAATLYGEHAHAAGGFKAPGEAQVRRFVLRGEYEPNVLTTGATLTLDGSQRSLFIPENASWNYSIKAIGRDLNGYKTAAYDIIGVLERTDLGAVILHETKNVRVKDDPNWNLVCSLQTKLVLRLNSPQLKFRRVSTSNFDYPRPIIDLNGDYEFIELSADNKFALFSSGQFWLLLIRNAAPYSVNMAFFTKKPAFLSIAAMSEGAFEAGLVTTLYADELTYNWDSTPFDPSAFAQAIGAAPVLKYPGYNSAIYENVAGVTTMDFVSNSSQALAAPYLDISTYTPNDSVRWVACVEALQVINPSVLIGYDYAYSS